MAELSTECQAFTRVVVDAGAAVFRSTKSMKWSHSLPRFGRTASFGTLLSGTTDERADYVVGSISTSIAIFWFFLLWMIMLLVMRCLGPEKVGLFSGRRPRGTANGEGCKDDFEYDLKLEEIGPEQDSSKDSRHPNDHNLQAVGMSDSTCIQAAQAASLNEANNTSKQNDNDQFVGSKKEGDPAKRRTEQDAIRDRIRIQRVRIAVLISGFIVILSAIMMTILGADSLTKSMSGARTGLARGQQLCFDAIDLIDEYIIRQEGVLVSLFSFRSTLNSICPNVREGICESLTPVANCTFEDLPEEVLDGIREFIVSSVDALYTELVNLQNDLRELADVLGGISDKTKSFSWAFWIAAVWSLILAIQTAILSYFVIESWKSNPKKNACAVRTRKFLRNWITIPVHAFLVVMSWIFTMIFLIGTAVSGDFCIDNPDPHVLDILHRNRDMFSTVLFEFTTYFISGCPPDNIPFSFVERLSHVERFFQLAYNISAYALSPSDEFKEICGGDPVLLTAAATTVQLQSCLLADTVKDIQQLLTCQNFHPPYEAIVYNALCREGNKGLAWLSIAQISIIFFTMIMLTLRIAFVDDEVDGVHENKKETCQSVLLKLFPWCRPGHNRHNEQEE